MIVSFKNAIEIFQSSIRFFLRYPISIFPLILCWCIYAPIILYLEFYMNWDAFNASEIFGIVFLIYFVFSFIIGTSCLILLEIVQQVESGKRPKLSKALKDCFFRDLIKALPVLIIWSIIWSILALLEAILSKKKDENDRKEKELTAKSAAKTLAGVKKESSLINSFFSALKKGLRMIVFIILPAVAWEELGPIRAIKKGLTVLRSTIPEFITGYALTRVFVAIVILPVAIIFYIDSEFSVVFPEFVWYFVLVYIAFSWSISFLVEQLYVAELYLWHIKWEDEYKTAKEEGKELPTLRGTPKPSFFDEDNSLKTHLHM